MLRSEMKKETEGKLKQRMPVVANADLLQSTIYTEGYETAVARLQACAWVCLRSLNIEDDLLTSIFSPKVRK